MRNASAAHLDFCAVNSIEADTDVDGDGLLNDVDTDDDNDGIEDAERSVSSWNMRAFFMGCEFMSLESRWWWRQDLCSLW